MLTLRHKTFLPDTAHQCYCCPRVTSYWVGEIQGPKWFVLWDPNDLSFETVIGDTVCSPVTALEIRFGDWPEWQVEEGLTVTTSTWLGSSPPNGSCSQRTLNRDDQTVTWRLGMRLSSLAAGLHSSVTDPETWLSGRRATCVLGPRSQFTGPLRAPRSAQTLRKTVIRLMRMGKSGREIKLSLFHLWKYGSVLTGRSVYSLLLLDNHFDEAKLTLRWMLRDSDVLGLYPYY